MGRAERIGRRDFMRRTSGLLVGATALSGRSFAANDKVRIGLIGCGTMGRLHAYSLAYNENCTIVAMCDVYIKKYVEVAKNVETWRTC